MSSACQRDGAADHPQAVTSGELAEEVLQGAGAVGFAQIQNVRAALAHEGEILRQHDQAGALLRRFRDQAFGLKQIGADIGTRRHLHGGGLDRCAHG